MDFMWEYRNYVSGRLRDITNKAASHSGFRNSAELSFIKNDIWDDLRDFVTEADDIWDDYDKNEDLDQLVNGVENILKDFERYEKNGITKYYRILDDSIVKLDLDDSYNDEIEWTTEFINKIIDFMPGVREDILTFIKKYK